ncbi:caspase family protein [Prosthecomicrobium sp. N25]|uniref:caspase family protein n=1 Tax=Prosthecomicrobium sp. N25 TaxID=3129254 RepID=UPI003077E77A
MTPRPRPGPLRTLAVLLSLVACLWSSAAWAASERRVALVIGNAAYRSIVALKNTRADAEDVSAALRDLGFEVMTRLDVERAGARDVLRDFSRLAAGADVALVYYAGHALEHEGRYYLMPVDVKIDDADALRFDAMPADDVRALLQDRVPGLRIMIFDACRNDPFGGRPPPSTRPEARPGAVPRGLQRAAAPRGLLTVYATAPLDVAEDGRSRNSPFTRAFLKRLREPNLEIADLFRRVSADVREATAGRQVPDVAGTLDAAYVLNPAETDGTAWARLRFSSRSDDLRDFLARFPRSDYAADARFRLDVLDREVRARQDRACGTEAERIDALVAARDAAGLAALRNQILCPASLGRVETGLREVERLRGEEGKRRVTTEACERERRDLDNAARAGNLRQVEEMRRRLACPANAEAAESALASLRGRAGEAERPAR